MMYADMVRTADLPRARAKHAKVENWPFALRRNDASLRCGLRRSAEQRAHRDGSGKQQRSHDCAERNVTLAHRHAWQRLKCECEKNRNDSGGDYPICALNQNPQRRRARVKILARRNNPGIHNQRRRQERAQRERGKTC